MLTLLLKRKARQAEEHAKKQKTSHSPSPTSTSTSTEESLKFTDRQWNETQKALQTDLDLLSVLAGTEEKEPFKKTLVKKYHGTVEKLLKTHENLAGLDVIWWWYLWKIDTENLIDVHDDFRAAISRGLETPYKWRSNGQTAYCDIIFKYSHDGETKKEPFNSQYLIRAVQDITVGILAINAPLKVKMFRLVGDWHLAKDEKIQAHDLFDIMMIIEPKKGGRKNKLAELKKELNHE